MIALVFLYLIASIFIFRGELNAAILGAKRKRNGNLKFERLCAEVTARGNRARIVGVFDAFFSTKE